MDHARRQRVAGHVHDAEGRRAGQHLARLRHLGELNARGWRRQHGQAAALDRLVEMDVTADDPADVRMLAERADQLVAVPERHGVDPLQAEWPRMVVDEDDRRLLSMLREIVTEPPELGGVERSTRLTGLL